MKLYKKMSSELSFHQNISGLMKLHCLDRKQDLGSPSPAQVTRAGSPLSLRRGRNRRGTEV